MNSTENENNRDQKLIRQRSSRRLRHIAQTKVFEVKHGSLDQIRQSLGLRPSQICELLKVHPSAWIRWNRTKRAPPHIYQMLEWYVEILKRRGQFKAQPANESTEVSQKVRLEDPATYVPFGLANLDFTSESRHTDGVQNVVNKTPETLQNSGFLIKILTISWLFQAVLTAILIFFLVKRS